MPISVYDPCGMVALVDEEQVIGFAGEDSLCVVQTSDSLKFILQVTSPSAVELKSKVGSKVRVMLKHKIYPSERESSVDYLDVFGTYLLEDYKAEFAGTKMATVNFYFQKESN